MKNTLVTGLYGCTCHPFQNWEEHDSFHKQKIDLECQYMIRHSGLKCVTKGFLEDNPSYVKIFVEPFDCPRCQQIEHKSNLIPINKNAKTTQKKAIQSTISDNKTT